MPTSCWQKQTLENAVSVVELRSVNPTLFLEPSKTPARPEDSDVATTADRVFVWCLLLRLGAEFRGWIVCQRVQRRHHNEASAFSDQRVAVHDHCGRDWKGSRVVVSVDKQEAERLLHEVMQDIKHVAAKYYQAIKWHLQCKDFEQELVIKVLKSMANWNPEKSEWRKFVRNRLTYMARDVIRENGTFNRRGYQQTDLTVQPLTSGESVFEHIAENPRMNEVDWSDLREAVQAKGSRSLQMVFDRFEGLSNVDISKKWKVTDSRVSQVLGGRDQTYQIALSRLAALAGEA